jgi:hypothetical protein
MMPGDNQAVACPMSLEHFLERRFGIVVFLRIMKLNNINLALAGTVRFVQKGAR